LLLAAASPVQSPRLIDVIDRLLIETYLTGDRFEPAYLPKAVAVLARLHTTLAGPVRSGSVLDRFALPSLASDVETMQNIVVAALANLPASSHWKHRATAALTRFPTPVVVDHLHSSAPFPVASHGDYKSDNLLLTPRSVAVLDWVSLSPGQPWYDLAYLSVDADESSRSHLTDLYLHLNTIPASRDVQARIRSGRLYQELVRSYSNASYVASGSANPHHASQMRIALANLLALSEVT